jgi:hypothetical protein
LLADLSYHAGLAVKSRAVARPAGRPASLLTAALRRGLTAPGQSRPKTRRITMANSKTFRTEVRCGNDNYNDIPTVVAFNIDEAGAAEIIRLAAIVKANDLYKVEKFDYRAQFLRYDPEQDPEEAKLAGEENEFRTEADLLNVSDTDFWFSAYIKHTDIEILSEQQRIDDLAKYFDRTSA